MTVHPDINPEEVEESLREAYVDPDPDSAPPDEEEPKVIMGSFMDNAEMEIWLSTDGKHTVHLKTNEPDTLKRKEAVAKTMELFDFVLARYGTKQAQAVKEYAKENGAQKPDQETCPHAMIKFAQSKTEKNPGRWFKSCQKCGKFLGWQS